MSDKHIEDLLRQSYNPEPPDGMRERILARARRELVPRRRVCSLFAIHGWKPALAALALLVLLLSGVSEHVRGVRLAALMGNDAGQATQNMCKSNLAQRICRMNAACALDETNGWVWDDGKEDDHESRRTN